MRLLHIISGLTTGGAEVLMLRTIERQLAAGIDCHVASIIGDGPIGRQLAELRVPVTDLRGRSVMQLTAVVRSMRGLVGSVRPDVIHSWMYHANAVTHLSARGNSGPPFVTSVHHSLDNESDAPLSRRLARFIDSKLSSHAATVIYPSRRGMDQHVEYGYSRANALFLPSGFDVRKFMPDAESRARQRHLLGIGPDELVIGSVARFDPIKDHETLLRAAAEFARSSASATFLLIGPGVSEQNAQFVTLMKKHAGNARCILLGERGDLPALFACMDVSCLSSKSEGFPLTLGEAMACGVSCLATDVGDCAYLLGDTGLLAPPGDAAALADRFRSLDRMGPEGRASLGERARARIIAEFSIEAYMHKLQSCYESALGERPRVL